MLSLALLALLPSLAFARPMPIFGFGDSTKDNAPSTLATTPVDEATINSTLVRPLQFSRIAYCNASVVQDMSCGTPCDAVGSGVQVLQIGGNNQLIPMYFIALDNSTQSVVVSHQGTDPKHLLSIANDVQIQQEQLNATFFPESAGNSSILVHSGFHYTFTRTAAGVLSGVQNALATSGFNNVAVTGHSLGAAVATFDAVMLKQNLDPSVNISTAVFGLPRSGNQAWADLVDATIGDQFFHVTNQHDPVPTVPLRDFLGLDYQQPSNEIHITAVNGADATTEFCPGQDNSNCSEGNSLLSADVSNHLGPYFNDISVGASQCPDV